MTRLKAVVLKKDASLPLKGALDNPREHAEQRRKQDLEMHLVFKDVDRRGHRLPHCRNVEIELIAGPAGLHLRAARNMLLELVEIVGDPAPRLVFAKLVRKIDFDGLSHSCDVARRSALFKLQHRSMISLMKFIALPFLMIAAAAPAQPAAPTATIPVQTVPIASPAPTQAAQTGAWDPVGPYITAGQDEPGYRSWFLAAPWRAAQVKAFNDYLVSNQVGGILPTWTLLRTATSWQECGGQPFEVPPADEWPHMVETLRYVRDYVIPSVGPVEAVSVYRNPQLNKCAGGAPESAHKLDSAIDMVPLRPITRVALMRTLCGVHTEHGAAYSAGLGFYAYLRFHVDSTKFRRWNMDPEVAAECPPILHPEDIASVGQPLPPTAATAASAPAPAPLAAGSSPTVTAAPTPPAPPAALPSAGLALPAGTPSGQPH